MIVLAFDLATNTGVAVGDSRDKAPHFWSEKFGEGRDGQGVKFSQCMDLTNRLIRQYRPDLITVEGALAQGGGGAAARIQLAMGLRACVLGVADMRRVPVAEYAVSTIRKHFIGHGKLERKQAKSETIHRCKMLGWDVANDNEADACALWDYARMMQRGIASLPPGGLFKPESHNARNKVD